MELCTARALSNLPHHKPFTPTHPHLRWKTSLSLKYASISRTNSALQYYFNSTLKSSGTGQYVKEEPDGVITVEDAQPVEKNDYGETESDKEDSPMDEQMKPFEFLEKLNIELDSEDSYPILLFGGGALVALWLAAAIVGSIDSIPVFPKLMEIVGLSYTLWFSTRYLIFKKNRDELATKIEEIKQQVLGSNDD